MNNTTEYDYKRIDVTGCDSQLHHVGLLVDSFEKPNYTFFGDGLYGALPAGFSWGNLLHRMNVGAIFRRQMV